MIRSSGEQREDHPRTMWQSGGRSSPLQRQRRVVLGPLREPWVRIKNLTDVVATTDLTAGAMQAEGAAGETAFAGLYDAAACRQSY